MRASARDLVVTAQGARFMGRTIPCALGRGGIGPKQGEGDRITPVGRWRLLTVFYRAARLPPPEGRLPTFPTGLFDGWSDDPKDLFYNKRIRPMRPRSSHENLRRPDPLYDIVVTTDFNTRPVIPGAGSAIFLHVWRAPRAPTAGCIAFRVADLRWILARWQARSYLVIAGQDRPAPRK